MSIRTLIADDVADLRMTYKVILEASDRFSVVAEAGDGIRAVELARRHQPDLVLLDIAMPEKDGMEALPEIRDAAPKAKVVILTGFEEDRLGQMARERGASLYLEKGISADRLVTSLLEVVGEAPSVEVQTGADGRVDEAGGLGWEEALAFIGHEIRNPLAVISGFGSTMEKQAVSMPPEQIADLAGRIARQARFVDGIVRSILLLRNVEADDVLVDIRSTDVPAFLEEIVPDLSMASRDHDLIQEVEDELPQVILDAERFRQVLTNLVANSARYSPRDGSIRLRVHSQHDAVIFDVEDEGPGVPPDLRERVFEKFVRLDRKSAGLGIGLFVARALVRAMGGEIGFVDAPTGARVRCRLRASP